MNNKIEFDLYRGKVLSLDDPLQKGRVQVKLLPEMKDIKDSNCPWFEPFEGNCGDNEMSSKSLPEVGSLVWMLADNKFYHRYYLPFKYNIQGKYDFSKIIAKLTPIGVDTTYRNIQFTLYEDGSLDFHNRDDGSHGFISSTGAYMFMDASGNVAINGMTDFAVKYTPLTTAMLSQDTATNTELTKISATLGAMVTAFTSLGVTIPPYVQGTITTDISASKVDSVLLP